MPDEPMKPQEPGDDRPDRRQNYGGTDRYEALLDVMEQEAEKVRSEGVLGAASPREGRIRLVVLTLLVTAFGLVQWKGSDWFGPEPIPAPTTMELEQSLRAAMYLQAQRIAAFNNRTGRLPDTLDEAGEPLPGVQYAKLGEDVYRLTGENRGVTLTYNSDQPPSALLGNAASLLGTEGSG